MTTHHATHERAAFSARLQQALAGAGGPWHQAGPTALMRHFNAAYGGAGITVHAARKWLVGEAIPSQPKLRVLAQLLDVAPDWLRYGDGAGGAPHANPDGLRADDRLLLHEFRALPPAAQQLVRNLMRDLAHFSTPRKEAP